MNFTIHKTLRYIKIALRNRTLRKRKEMIRRALVADAEDMDRINRMVLPENYPIDFWRQLIQSPSSSNFIVKNEQNETVAYILSAAQFNKQQRLTGHVYSIGVLPEYSRKGYGSLLLKAIENDYRNPWDVKIDGIHKSVNGAWNIRTITLHVRKTNKKAIDFYHKNGYLRKKKVKDYYGKGNDGFLMERIL